MKTPSPISKVSMCLKYLAGVGANVRATMLGSGSGVGFKHLETFEIGRREYSLATMLSQTQGGTHWRGAVNWRTVRLSSSGRSNIIIGEAAASRRWRDAMCSSECDPSAHSRKKQVSKRQRRAANEPTKRLSTDGALKWAAIPAAWKVGVHSRPPAGSTASAARQWKQR